VTTTLMLASVQAAEADGDFERRRARPHPPTSPQFGAPALEPREITVPIDPPAADPRRTRMPREMSPAAAAAPETPSVARTSLQQVFARLAARLSR
jgi:hypothetical protein